MRQTWRAVARIAAPEWPRLTVASLLASVTVATSLALMGSSAWLIAMAAFHPSIAVLQVAIVGVRAFGLSRGLSRYGERLLTHDATLRLLTRFRLDVYGWLTRPPVGARLSSSTGDALARLIADLDTLEHGFTRVAGPIAAAALSGSGLTLFLWLLHPPAAACLAFGLMVGGVLAPALAWILSIRADLERVRLRGELHAVLVDGLQGAAELLANGAERRWTLRVQSLGAALAATERRIARLTSAGPAVSAWAADVATIAVAALGAHSVFAGELAPVRYAVVVLLTAASGEIIALMPGAWQALSSTGAAATRVLSPDSGHDAARATATNGGVLRAARDAARVVTSRLSFTYPGGAHPALHAIDLDLSAGRLVAVVGDSGSGKSTLIQVLLRFWPLPAGMAMLNGRDLGAFPEGDLRHEVAWMGQQAHILTGTIRENVALARPEADDRAVWMALNGAGLDGFVRQLPDGLDTWIGELGATLSGGERQRLALARVLLADRPVVLLDEPTSQVDAETEAHLLRTFAQLAQGTAVLLATHRLAPLAIADEIVVLSEGRVVERGRFEALAAREGGPFRTRLLRERGELTGND